MLAQHCSNRLVCSKGIAVSKKNWFPQLVAKGLITQKSVHEEEKNLYKYILELFILYVVSKKFPIVTY